MSQTIDKNTSCYTSIIIQKAIFAMFWNPTYALSLLCHMKEKMFIRRFIDAKCRTILQHDGSLSDTWQNAWEKPSSIWLMRLRCGSGKFGSFSRCFHFPNKYYEKKHHKLIHFQDELRVITCRSLRKFH